MYGVGVDIISQGVGLVQQALAAVGYAQPFLVAQTTVPDVVQILMGLNDSLPAIQKLVTAISYLAGIFLVFKAVYLMKQYGELRTMMSLQTDLRGPIMMIVIGCVLVYLPTSYHAAISTFWAYDSVLQIQVNYDDKWSLVSGLVQHLVQLVGLIAFIRGWLLMAKVVSKNNQTATFSKAMTHIVGGILALNIVGTKEIINATLGVNL